MKTLLLIFVLFTLSACANMTPRQKQTTAIVGAIVVGAVIISANDGNTNVHNNNGCHGRCDRDK